MKEGLAVFVINLDLIERLVRTIFWKRSSALHYISINQDYETASHEKSPFFFVYHHQRQKASTFNHLINFGSRTNWKSSDGVPGGINKKKKEKDWRPITIFMSVSHWEGWNRNMRRVPTSMCTCVEDGTKIKKYIASCRYCTQASFI